MHNIIKTNQFFN